MAVQIRPEKAAAVAELKEKISAAKAVVLANNKGLNVAQAVKLRKEFRAKNVEFKVAKNTLIRIAAKELGIEGLDPLLEGPTTLAISYDDEVTGAKLITEFVGKDRNPKLEIKGGVLEGRVINAAAVKELADLPSKEVLVAQVIAGVQAPLVGVVGAVNGILASVVYAIDARIRQLGEGAA